jgi:hypothetical protein
MSAQPLCLALLGKSRLSVAVRNFLLMFLISVCALTFCICTKAQTPPQQYVYAGVPLASATSKIAAFSKDSSTGGLSLIPSSPTLDKLEGGSMAVDALGRFLFVLDSATSKISMFQIDGNTGALNEVPASPFSAGPTENPGLAPTSPISIAAEASGQFLYVGYAFGNLVGQKCHRRFSHRFHEAPAPPAACPVHHRHRLSADWLDC